MTETLLSVSGLCQQVRDHTVLREVSFNVAKGELIGVIGPNGVGKSTLLKTLLHFTPASAGEVLLGGDNVAGLAHRDRAARMAYLAQDASESFAYRVIDLVKMGAHRHAQTELDKRATQLLQELAIEHLSQRLINELSGGERQLVHFARMLMQDAELLLLDEPTAALDIGHEAEILGHLRRITHQQDKSALLAIHNLNSAAEFCDRLLVLDQGELIADGAPGLVLTQALIQRLYGNRAVVGRHPQTGSTTVLPVREARAQLQLKAHVIGGAGSAVLPSKWLHDAGFQVSGGVAHEQDSDTLFWQQQQISHTTVAAFSDISDVAFEAALAHVQQADWVLLCDFPIGRGNARNLQLAASAKRLIVVRDELTVPDYLSTELAVQLQALFAQAEHVSLAQLPTRLAQLRRTGVKDD